MSSAAGEGERAEGVQATAYPVAGPVRFPRWLLALPLLFLLLGALVRPAAALVWPDYGAWVATPLTQGDLDESLWVGSLTRGQPFVREASVSLDDSDPWGRAWRLRLGAASSRRYVLYSVGADGVDQQGAGDDVDLGQGPGMRALDSAPAACGVAALALAWALLVIRLARARRSSRLELEALRAAALAIVPAGLAAWALLSSDLSNNELVAPLAARLVVPLPVAASGAVACVAYLGALWLRLRRPLAQARIPTGESEDSLTPVSGPHWGRVIGVGLGLVTAVALLALGAHARYQAWLDARLLARAQLGDWRSVDELLVGDDLEPVRRFLAAPGPRFHSGRLSRAEFEGLIRVGPDALPTLLEALAGDQPFLNLPPIALDEIRRLDPDGARLLARVDAEPRRYLGVLLGERGLLTRRVGRQGVLERLMPHLDDKRLVPRFTGSGYRPRVCDRAAEAVRRLALRDLEGVPQPDPSTEVSAEDWDVTVAGLQAWWREAEGRPALTPQGWLHLTVQEIDPALVRQKASFEVRFDLGVRGSWGSASPLSATTYGVEQAFSDALTVRLLVGGRQQQSFELERPERDSTVSVTVDWKDGEVGRKTVLHPGGPER